MCLQTCFCAFKLSYNMVGPWVVFSHPLQFVWPLASIYLYSLSPKNPPVWSFPPTKYTLLACVYHIQSASPLQISTFTHIYKCIVLFIVNWIPEILQKTKQLKWGGLSLSMREKCMAFASLDLIASLYKSVVLLSTFL